MRSFHLLYAGGDRVARSLDLPEVLGAFAGCAQLTVAEHARRGLFVHAGVVEWNGAAVLMPGRSFSGKSTLVLAFLRAGARYYSDEYAVIDEAGAVHPFPRPISIRGSADAPPAGVPGVRAIPVRWIIVTSFREGARWRPRTLTPGDACLSLLANTVAARRLAKTALARFERVVEAAVAWKGGRGEADELVREFRRRVMDSRA
jgi:hypothetical protein